MRCAVPWLGFAALLLPCGADGLVLTGLSRQGGVDRAYFSRPADGTSFSLVRDEDYAGQRLLEINFAKGWALVADAQGTNRVAFAKPGKDPRPSAFSGTATRPQNSVNPRFRPAQPPAPGVPTATAQPINAVIEGATQFEVEPSNTAVAGPAGTPETNGLNPGSEEPPRANRQPTADELYRIRNGNAAYEDMLMARHNAEVLAARAAGLATP